jgi:hypothetical protein
LREIESELVEKGRWEGKLVHTTRDGGCLVVESRWTLNIEEQSDAVVEINTPSDDSIIGIPKLGSTKSLIQVLRKCLSL